MYTVPAVPQKKKRKKKNQTFKDNNKKNYLCQICSASSDSGVATECFSLDTRLGKKPS